MVKNLPSVERSTKIRFGKHVPDSNDQEENTVVFNASNVLVPTPYSNAVYLSPIRNRPDFTAPEVVLLMYDRNTKEITESGESANNLVGGATLSLAVDRANVTSNTIIFTGGGHDDNNVGFVTDSNVGISNLLPEHTLSVGTNFYVDDTGSNVLVVSGNVAVLRDMVIDGNLRVNGDTTVIYAENTAIKDALIELGQNNTSEDTTLDLGVLMHRPEALSNVVIGYREESDEFAIGYTDANPTDKTFTPKSDEDINVHVYGLTHVDANIYAHEDLVVDGNVYVSQNVSVTEELTISGNVYADKDLEVVGNVYVYGNVVASQDLTLSGNAYVSGNVVASQDLTLSGNAYVSGNVVASQDLLVTGNVYVSTNVDVTQELTVSGNVYADKDLEVVGNVFVDGNVVAYQDLLVTGNVYVSTNVDVTQELTVSGNVYADKDLEVVGNVYVDGNVVAYQDLLVTGNVYAYTNVEIAQELTITGNAYADRDLEVAGDVYVDGNVVAYQDILVTGNVYVSTNVSVSKELTVTGNVYADKDLEVVGNTYVSGNVEVTKDLIVTGNTHLEGPNVFITHTMDFLDPTTAIVTDLNSNVEVKLNQLANVVIGTKALANEDMLVYDGSNWTNQLQNHTFLHAKAEEAIAKGDAVYATGTVGNNTFSIRKAQSNSSATMPALGLAYQAFTLNQEGLIVTFGRSDGINTDNFITGETVYVSNVTAGALSNVKPYGATDLIQNIGLVVKGHPSTGIVSVTGVGRSNDIPNAVIETSNASVNYVYVNSVNNDLRKIDPMKLPTKLQTLTQVVNTGNTVANAVTLRGLSITSGSGFNGDLTVTGNVTVDTNTFKVNAEANRVGILTSEPEYNLDVRGTSNVGIFTAPDATITDSTASTSKTTGALKVVGGVGVQGALYGAEASFSGVTSITDSTASTSKTTGALKVVGGVGVQGALYGAEASFSGVTSITDSTAANDTTSGALKVTGGVGVQGDLYANDGHFTSDLSVGNLTDPNNKYLPMVGTDGVFVKSPVYVAPSGKYVISASEAEFLGNITLGGNTTLLTSTSLVVEDRIIGIGSNNSAEGFDSGIIIEHEDGGVFANIALIHHADEHRFSIGYTQNTLTDNHILNASHPDNVTLRIDLIGNTIVQNNLTVNENSIFSGKVGIKTGTPGFDLDVRGTANVGAFTAITGTFTGDIEVDTNVLKVDTTLDRVGIKTGTPTGELHVVGNAFVTSNITTSSNVIVTGTAVATSNTTGALQVAGGVGISGSVYADAAYISSNLNVDGTTLHVDSVSNRVGVGKTDPGFTLDVNGDINFSGGLNQGGSPFVSSPWTIAVNDDLSYTSGNVTVGTTLFHVDTQTSNIGIGKTDPGFTLDVNGDVNFSGSLYEGGSPFVSTPWTIDGNDLEYTSGNIGIGTNAAAATLHVGGNIYSTSNISAYEIEVANVITTNLLINTVTVSTTLSLDSVVNVSNITSNTVQFTNSNVSIAATGNVVADYFKGNGSELTGIATTLQSVSGFGNTTSNTVQFTNSNVSIAATSNIHIGGVAKQSSVPAFTVRLTDGTIVGAGDLNYNQVDTDNTSSYTAVNGRFTAPVAGHYFFSAHGIYQNDITIYDFTVSGTRQNINSLCSSPSANYIQCNISAVLYLNVGEYVTVYQVEGGTFGTDNNVFTGFFIG